MNRRRSDIGLALRQALASDTGVRTLAGDRIRPDVLSVNEELPAVRIEVLNDETHATLSGEGELRRARIQIDCYGATRAAANATAHAVEDAIAGRQGDVFGVWVNDCIRESGYDRTDSPSPGASEFRRRRTLDFVVSYQAFVAY